jgi:hypothetical protein
MLQSKYLLLKMTANNSRICSYSCPCNDGEKRTIFFTEANSWKCGQREVMNKKAWTGEEKVRRLERVVAVTVVGWLVTAAVGAVMYLGPDLGT